MKNKHFLKITRVGLLRNRHLHKKAVVNLIPITDTGRLSTDTIDMFFSINNGPKAATVHHSTCQSKLLGREMGKKISVWHHVSLDPVLLPVLSQE